MKTGDKIRLIHMPNDHDPIPVGATGTVQNVVDLRTWTQIWVKWDAPHDNRTLHLVVPPDEACVVDE